MDIDALTDDDLDQLASQLAGRLPTGRYGGQFVLSRRQLLSLAGGSAGVAGLTALGVDPATAQSAAGQVGTQSSPEDAYLADVEAQSVSTDELSVNIDDWSDSSSKSVGNTYQNTTGRLLEVAVILEADGGSPNTVDANLNIGSSSSLGVGDRSDQYLQQSSSPLRVSLSGIVPPDHYYEANSFGNSVTNRWQERQW